MAGRQLRREKSPSEIATLVGYAADPGRKAMEQVEEIEVLLVEDNALDAELTLRALKKG